MLSEEKIKRACEILIEIQELEQCTQYNSLSYWEKEEFSNDIASWKTSPSYIPEEQLMPMVKALGYESIEECAQGRGR